jgi:tetratricopeptide (TPR) repeat protein
LNGVNGSARGEAIALGLLSDAYHGVAEYQKAVDCLHRALPMFQSHQADRYNALCLFKLGRSYEAMGSDHEAIPYLEESARVFRQLLLPGRADQALALLERCRLGVSAEAHTN